MSSVTADPSQVGYGGYRRRSDRSRRRRSRSLHRYSLDPTADGPFVSRHPNVSINTAPGRARGFNFLKKIGPGERPFPGGDTLSHSSCTLR